MPVFSSAGTLYELRLMIEFSGANRGYCYVRYATLADADQARRSQVPPFYILVHLTLVCLGNSTMSRFALESGSMSQRVWTTKSASLKHFHQSVLSTQSETYWRNSSDSSLE